MKPLPLIKTKEESKVSNPIDNGKVASNIKSGEEGVIHSILEPADTMQASVNFLPKFGIDVCDEEQDPPVVISHQNGGGVVEDSDSGCDLEECDDAGKNDQQEPQIPPNQQKPLISNNDSAIFSKTPLKAGSLKAPADSERALNNKKTAESYVNGLLNKIWDS